MFSVILSFAPFKLINIAMEPLYFEFQVLVFHMQIVFSNKNLKNYIESENIKRKIKVREYI